MDNKRTGYFRDALKQEIERVDKVLTEQRDGATNKLETLVESLHVYQSELEMQNIALEDSNRDNHTLRLYYRSLFNLMPMPCFVVDKRLTIVESNSAARELVSTSGRRVYSQIALHQIFVREQAQVLFQQVSKSAKSEDVSEFQVRCKVQNETRIFRGLSQRVSNHETGADHCLLMLEDITNTIRLRDQESLFVELLDNAKEMMK